jgi:hypothetical protein
MRKAKKEVARLKISELPRHLAWTDAAFEEKIFRDMLDIIVGFKENGGSLKINSLDKFGKLREGIKNGTIVKEMKPDGSYIWKKVRK